MAQLKALVLDGTVMSDISDTVATSSAGKVGDPLIQTSTPPAKTFHGLIGGEIEHLT